MLRASMIAALCAAGALWWSIATPGRAAPLGSETRSVSGIERVELQAVGELEIVQGPDEGLVVEAEPRLLPRIATTVSNGTLTIATTGGGFSTSEPIRYRLRVRRLSGIESSGSGSVTAAALRCDRLRVAASGSGDVRIAKLDANALAIASRAAGSIAIDGGRVDAASIRLSGAGSLAAPTLAIRHADVEIDGSGEATLHVLGSLVASVDGAGRVAYRGTPTVKARVGGAGVVERDESGAN